MKVKTFAVNFFQNNRALFRLILVADILLIFVPILNMAAQIVNYFTVK